MSWLRFTWAMLRARGMAHLLTISIIALGVGLMTAMVAVSDAAKASVSSTAARYPMVIGPRIGAVPLVLGSLTGLQDLEASMDASVLDDLAVDPRVDLAVPILAGHAVAGFPLVGTGVGLFQPRERYPLADGRIFNEDAMELVAGAEAAAGLELRVGDMVTVEHQHAGAPEEPGALKLVGVLAPSGTDTDHTLYCPVEAIFRTHHHGGEAHHHGEEARHHVRAVSAVLVKPTDTSALLSLQEDLGEQAGLEVALTGQTLRRVMDRLAGGGRLAALMVAGVVMITFLSLLLSVYSTAMGGSRDVAVMRVMGARRLQVVGMVFSSMLAVSLAGAVLGAATGALLGHLAQGILQEQLGLDITVTVLSGSSLTALGAAVAVLVLVGIQPALAAYHLQAVEVLADVPGSAMTTRSRLRWAMRFALPLAVFIWAQQMMSRHGAEPVGQPIDQASAAFFKSLQDWSGGAPHPEVSALHGQDMDLEGYMYAVGDPFTVEDFHLVGMDPRLPRCPFCYRAPTRKERVLVRTGGRTLEVAPGPVRVTGTWRVDPDAADPYSLDMELFKVVVDR